VSDLVFVAAAYGVILGGLAGYAITLVRRLSQARAAAADPKAGEPPRPAPG
jgi:hypothetical protein